MLSPAQEKNINEALPIPYEAQYSGDILASFIDQVKDYAIFILDKTGCILTWNSGAEYIKGYSAEEVIGKHISIFYTQADILREIPASNLAHAAQAARYEDEGWRVRKNGTLFWANVVFTALYDANGGVRGFAKITRDMTTRKQHEDEAAGLAALIKYTSDAVFSTTTSLEIMTWNNGAEQLYGYAAGEVMGKTTLATIKPSITPAFLAERTRVIAERGYWKGEIAYVHKTGHPVIVSASISAIRNERKQVTGYIFITRDITAQKQAIEKINYLANIVEHSSDAIFSYNGNLELMSWNRAAEQLYGFSAAEAINKNAQALLRPEITEATRNMIRHQIAENGCWTGEVKHHRKDGSLIDLYISLTVNRDETGTITENICSCRDITSRKKAEETERRLKEQLDKLLQNRLDSTLKELSDYKYALDTSSIVAITNQKGIIGYVNDNFCNISGYSRHELIGQDHRLINSGHHDKQFINNLWVTIAHGKVWKGEIKNRAKNGSFYWVDTTIVPFLTDAGKPYQYVAIRVDITERKKAEEELNMLNGELEQRIKTRTNQLEIAVKELEAFSYSVSHDLRAPLRSINGFARILSDEYGKLLDREASRLLGKITRNAVMMGKLIDDLLDFTKLGKLDAACNEVNMEQLVSACLAEIRQQNNTALQFNYQIDRLPVCAGDQAMLKQVWLNLLSNAVKYSSKKQHPSIHVSAREDAENNIYIVKDNGDGFDMQFYNQLFGVFQRLHTASQFEGTGVGLAIVKLIIDKHKGEVWAESAVGEGATFYFRLPKISFYG